MALEVTPCVGVWIEIESICNAVIDFSVTPCVGVWIEMIRAREYFKCGFCHSLRGSVD